MRRIFLLFLCLPASLPIFAQGDSTVAGKDSFYLLSPVEVRAVRAGELAPFPKTNISQKDIQKLNIGQDIPFILNQTPSVVAASDAGNGIGYTGIRIRGVDATRINITLNGIPFNDAESQGSFFVDIPDFASSSNGIQVQRGVGLSSNGVGSFGANINFSTNEHISQPYGEFGYNYGSFNTWKNTVKTGTGLMYDHFTVDIRLSRIHSDGYVDRASSDLRAFAFSPAFVSKNTSVRANIILGKERTYQAWYGITEADLLNNNRTINYAGTEKPGKPYENETDNYLQDHYQLFVNQKLGEKLDFSTAVFLTTGNGYYEQYRAGEEYSRYGLPNTGTSDFVRQLWLDNEYYGNIFSFQYRSGKTQATLGGSFTQYGGRHFGELTWASNGMPEPTHQWYDLDALKTDYSIYARQQTRFSDWWHFFTDFQFRHVRYNIDGFRDNPSLFVKNRYSFFNPKIGLTYSRDIWKAYLSYSAANKEPNREDFETGTVQKPRREQLHDFETGIEKATKDYSWGVNLYYMRYREQLVLTGRINDVGAYTRMNVPRSFRMGIELQGTIRFNRWLNAGANLAISRNRVLDLDYFLDDYDNGGQVSRHLSSSDLALSPNIVSAGTINIIPIPRLELSILSKFVDKQYLDNTQDASRVLEPYFVQDLRTQYSFKWKKLKEGLLHLQIVNLFNRKYEPNGYTYTYITGGEILSDNRYFPMAGRHFIAGINLKF
jgi:iron complex outermembrane recepter protein